MGALLLFVCFRWRVTSAGNLLQNKSKSAVQASTALLRRKLYNIGKDRLRRTCNMNRRTVTSEKLLPRGTVFAAQNIICLVAGVIFSVGRLPGGAAPLGISLACAAVGREATLFCSAGALIGGIISKNTVCGIGAPAALLLRTILCLFLMPLPDEEIKQTEVSLKVRLASLTFDESVWARMLLASALVLICGCINPLGGSYSISYLASLAVAGAISPIAVYLYAELFAVADEISVTRRAASCVAALSCVLGAASILPFINLALPTAFLISVAAQRRHGVLWGLLYSVFLGFACPIQLSPIPAIASLASAPFAAVAPAASVACALIASSLWALYALGLSAMRSVVPSLIVSAAICAPLCASGLIKRVENAVSASNSVAADGVAELREGELRRKMHSLSEGFASLSKVLFRLSEREGVPDTDELSELCRDAFETYCGKCGMYAACFGNGGEAEELCENMVLALNREGRVSAALVSRSLASRCFNMGRIIDSVNSAVTRLTSQAQLYGRTSVVAADYELTSQILAEASEGGEGESSYDAQLSERLCRAFAKKSICAESVGVFGTRRLRIIARGVDMKICRADEEEIITAAQAVCGVKLLSPEFSLVGGFVTMTLNAAPSLSVRCGRASIAMSALGARGKHTPDDRTKIFSMDRRGLGKTSDSDCGDVIDAFETDDGRFFMLISDGMGTGREAALSSGICAVFIEKLLRAGAGMDTSLKMLNALLRARGGECSATVDLLELDLMNGRVRLVKSGAAPSFVIRDGRLFRLQSKTVPIGILRALDAELINFEAKVGDRIVMLSDGVAKSFEDCPWLYELLGGEALRGRDPSAMAQSVLRGALDNGACDDITAGVVLIGEA